MTASADSAPSAGREAGPILLLCPPADPPYQRDCYCSHLTKAAYYWQPYDLVVQSGYLAPLGPVELYDATALKKDPGQALADLGGRPWRAVLSLVGSMCWDGDLAFLRNLHQACGAPIFVSGDAVCGHPRRTLEAFSFIAGVLLSYISPDLRRYLAGEPPPYEGLCLREHPRRRAPSNGGPRDTFTLPMPQWDLFASPVYRLPFLKRLPFAPVASSFGCPFHCRFCTAADLNFQLRDLDNVLAELRHLKAAGYREIHFKDMSFGAIPGHYQGLLQEMIDSRMDLSFFCLARADHLNAGFTALLKRAGCHLVHLGAESASPETLQREHKQIQPDQVRRAVGNCKQAGLRTLASYVLGLPGETPADMTRTVEYALDLDTDFVSFNLYSQRNGWPGYPAGDLEPVPPTVRDLQHLAYRRFYFRPSYLLKQARSLSSPTQLRLSLSNAMSLARQHLLPADRHA